MTSRGIALPGPLPQLAAQARAAEASGFDSIWCSETVHEAFVQAAVMVASTSSVRVGTGIVLAFPRSPTITAMAAWDLDELSGGRFTLGVGSQVKGVLERRFSVAYEPAAAKMAEYVEVLRTVWRASRGEDVRHVGRFYTVKQPGFYGSPAPERRLVPVHVAAVGPRMLATAGRVADGVVGHGFTTPRYVAEVVRPAIEGAAAGAGRPAGAVEVGTGVIVAVSGDGAEARREAARQVAFYATTPAYEAVLALHGWEEMRADAWAAFTRSDLGAMADAVPDEVLDTVAVAGTPDEVADRLAAYEAVCDEVVVSVPWFGVGPERAAENFTALVECLGVEPARPAEATT